MKQRTDKNAPDLDADSLNVLKQIDDAIQPYAEFYDGIIELQKLSDATSSTRWLIDSETSLDLSISAKS